MISQAQRWDNCEDAERMAREFPSCAYCNAPVGVRLLPQGTTWWLGCSVVFAHRGLSDRQPLTRVVL